MNAIHAFNRDAGRKTKVSKRNLEARIIALEDVVQELLEWIAKKHETKLGVMPQTTQSGIRFTIYENPLYKDEPSA